MTIETTTYPAIPLDAGQIHGWEAIPIHEVGRLDPLIPLGPLSQEAGILTTSSLYFGEHDNSPYVGETNRLEGSLLTLFARQSTARRLLTAEQLLPTGYHLLLFDAYRPYQVQKSLHDFYKRKLREKHPDADDNALECETRNYVSLPSTDPTRPSPHSTGGVVDVAIIKLGQPYEKMAQQIRSRLGDTTIDFAKRVGLEMQLSAIMRRYGKMLWFGTPFDHGGEKSALTYFETRLAAGETLTDSEMQACRNRRLLFSVMTQAGFEPYFAEWWHFDAPESQWGAAAAGYDRATFSVANLNKSNIAHENKRLKLRQEALRLQKKGGSTTKRTALQAEMLAVIAETADLLQVKDWPAEIIAPPEA